MGKGDYIGAQFSISLNPADTITLSEHKPAYTSVWSRFRVGNPYADLTAALDRGQAETAGEYIFFPVQDQHLFLPSATAYNIPPHNIDLLCQNIRSIEAANGWDQNHIFIVGDRFHQSVVRTEDAQGVVEGTEEVISLESIAARYKAIDIVDPTDIVLQRILKLAQGRRIVFRATREGMTEYKARFYERLHLLGYRSGNHAKGTFTVGYDLFEDQIEQQTICAKHDDYFPVVLSKNVFDALIRNGYQEDQFIYVPQLVIAELIRVASRQ